MEAAAHPHVEQHEAVHGHIHPEPQGFIRKYVFSLDHKVIAIQYFITGLLFMLIAGSFAELIRLQLWNPAGTFMTFETYNVMFTMHGTVMVWLVLIPLVTGSLGNLVMPLQIGARDVAFPWLNMFSFWLVPVAGLTLFSSFIFGPPAHTGWTEYPPLSVSQGTGGALWCAAIIIVGISSTLTGLNFMTTVVKMRAPGMTWTRMPLFTWATFATALVNLFATVALSAALLALFLAIVFDVPFFDAARGGSAILFQHMFWFYSHPAVYIFILPAFGVISEILPTFARKTIFGYKMIAFSSLAIAILGFAVWMHHMFPSGIAPWVQIPFMILTYCDRDPDRDQDLLVDGDGLGRPHPVHHPDALRAGVHRDVQLRRDHRRLLGRVPADLARARQLLRRRALPLRGGGRRGPAFLRRLQLLVPEGDRPAAQRDGSGRPASGSSRWA